MGDRSRICSFMTIGSSSSQTIRCLCRLSLKLGDCQSSMLLMVLTALHCFYMASKCLFHCLLRKLLTTTAGLMANDLERF